MSEIENKKQTDDNIETKHHSHHHHHHHHHHSHKRRSHHTHHKSNKNGNRNKFKHFFKRNKKRLGYIAISLIVVIALVFLSLFLDSNLRSNKKDDSKNQPYSEGSLIKIGIPFYAEPLSTVSPAVSAYLESDSAVGSSKYYNEYRKSGQRLDIGIPIKLYYDIDKLPQGCSVAESKMYICENASFEDSLIYKFKKNERTIKVYNLKSNTQYYYRVELILSNDYVTSAQGTFKTADTPRLMNIDGAVNVRDIGGWKTANGKTVRQGLLYRGSELDGAVESEFFVEKSGIEELVTNLGVRTEMDLRSPADNKDKINPLGDKVNHIYYDSYMYSDVFTPVGSTAVKRAFSDLANSSNYPIYLHCTYGMDRTGTVCYLLGALLGIDRHDLMRDYQLSTFYYGNVKLDKMNEFIAVLETYNGNTLQEKTENYLLSIGVTQQEIESIRNIFLG